MIYLLLTHSSRSRCYRLRISIYKFQTIHFGQKIIIKTNIVSFKLKWIRKLFAQISVPTFSAFADILFASNSVALKRIVCDGDGWGSRMLITQLFLVAGGKASLERFPEFIFVRRCRSVEWALDSFTHFIADAYFQPWQQCDIAPTAATVIRFVQIDQMNGIGRPSRGPLIIVIRIGVIFERTGIFVDIWHGQRSRSQFIFNQREFSADRCHLEPFIVECIPNLWTQFAVVGGNIARIIILEQLKVDSTVSLWHSGSRWHQFSGFATNSVHSAIS